MDVPISIYLKVNTDIICLKNTDKVNIIFKFFYII